MSMPLYQLQPPPPSFAVVHQQHTSNSGKGSIGPVIAILVAITILGVISCMIGRLCAGRRIMGHGQYNFERWIERKFSSCIDGRIEAPSSSVNGGGGSVPVSIPAEIPEETKQTEQDSQNRPENAAS